MSGESHRIALDVQAGLDNSRVNIYGLASIVEASKEGPIEIYNQRMVNPAIWQARAQVKTIERQDGQPGLAWLAQISLDNSVFSSEAIRVVKALSRLHYPSFAKPDQRMVGKVGGYNMAQVSVAGLPFMVYPSTHRDLIITNKATDNRLYHFKPDQDVSVEPPPLEGTDQRVVANAFARLFMLTANYCNSVDVINSTRIAVDEVPWLGKAALFGQDLSLSLRRMLTVRDKLQPRDLVKTYAFADPKPLPIAPPQAPASQATSNQSTTPGTPKHALIKSQSKPAPKPPKQKPPRDRLAQYDSARYIKSALEPVEPQFSLEDIGGHKTIKEELGQLITSSNHPEVTAKWGVPKGLGILFYGEHGNGKRMFVHALAQETNSELWVCDSAKIFDMWQGMAGQNTKAMFDAIARSPDKLVVFFDEIDAILSVPNNPAVRGNNQERNQVLGIFKQELESLLAQKPNVIIAGATNVYDVLDPAVMRAGRFDYKYYIANPNEDERKEIIAKQVMELFWKGHISAEVDIEKLAYLTDEFSGADLTTVFERIKRAKSAEEYSSGRASPITQTDIEQEINRSKK